MDFTNGSISPFYFGVAKIDSLQFRWIPLLNVAIGCLGYLTPGRYFGNFIVSNIN